MIGNNLKKELNYVKTAYKYQDHEYLREISSYEMLFEISKDEVIELRADDYAHEDDEVMRRNRFAI